MIGLRAEWKERGGSSVVVRKVEDVVGVGGWLELVMIERGLNWTGPQGSLGE